jgi:DNA-directed RNA polymerase subunit RPC12/RpoP
MASKAKTFMIVGIIWFLMAAAIWIGLGYYFFALTVDESVAQSDQQLMTAIASIFIIFGLIAFVFLVLTVAAVLGPFKKDRYDAVYNRGLLIGGIGLFFGLGAGVMLILAAKKHIKNHPKYMATLPVPTPICERCGQPVQFDKEVGGWYCPTCKIHLTKGVAKPQPPAKPVLPPTMPPKPVYAPPQQPYPPQGGQPKPMGPPPQGYPPQQGMAPKPMGPPPQGYPPQQGMAPPKPMGPPPQGYPPQQGMAPPKPMGPPPQGYPPQQLPPNVRVLACSRCGKTFQWTVTDPNQRMAKCPWCNNELMIQ